MQPDITENKKAPVPKFTKGDKVYLKEYDLKGIIKGLTGIDPFPGLRDYFSYYIKWETGHIGVVCEPELTLID